MIISHYHKFVFVKTNKTAGSSLEALLTRHLQPGDMITRRNDMDVVKEIAGKGIEILNSKGSPYRRSFMNHSPLSDAHQIFPETKKVFMSNNCNMLIDIRLFPLPDSPIIPKISFSNSLNETLSTIFSVAFFLRQILSFFISNIGLLAFKN